MAELCDSSEWSVLLGRQITFVPDTSLFGEKKTNGATMSSFVLDIFAAIRIAFYFIFTFREESVLYRKSPAWHNSVGSVLVRRRKTRENFLSHIFAARSQLQTTETLFSIVRGKFQSRSGPGLHVRVLHCAIFFSYNTITLFLKKTCHIFLIWFYSNAITVYKTIVNKYKKVRYLITSVTFFFRVLYY